MNRYQGVVAMQGESLEEMAQAYFRQSEQIPTLVRLAVAQTRGPRRWRQGALARRRFSGAVPAQRFKPRAGARPAIRAMIPSGADLKHRPRGADDALDHWREAEALIGTIEAAELVDPQVGSDQLLFRLFHERGVRVFEAAPVREHCTCSVERVQTTVKAFGEDPDEGMIRDGAIEVTCEFCSKLYRFDPQTYEPV
jgi:molecular chaperone Hsp33